MIYTVRPCWEGVWPSLDPWDVCGQKDGGSPIDSIVTGVREKSRTGIVKALKNFVEEDNHNGVDVGCLRRGTRSIRVTKPQFSDAYPEAVIREGADELTLRAEDVGSLGTFVDTTNIELMVASVGRCELARLSSSHLQRNRRTRMGNVVLLQGFASGGGNQEAGRQSQVIGPLDNESGKGQNG